MTTLSDFITDDGQVDYLALVGTLRVTLGDFDQVVSQVHAERVNRLDQREQLRSSRKNGKRIGGHFRGRTHRLAELHLIVRDLSQRLIQFYECVRNAPSSLNCSHKIPHSSVGGTSEGKRSDPASSRVSGSGPTGGDA